MLEITKINDLPEDERQRFVHLLLQICPHAKLEGVVRTAAGWDTRLVVSSEGEEQQALIRFYGPDVASFPPIKNRVLKFLRSNDNQNAYDLSSFVLECGEYRDEPWYLRLIVKETLADRLEKNAPSLGYAKNIAQQLISILQRYHLSKAAHGHISPANIAVEENGKIYLLDAGIAAATIQSAKCLGFGDQVLAYNTSELAPEVIEKDRLFFEADLYGLGKTLELLFSAVGKTLNESQVREKEEIDLLIEISKSLSATESKDRPSLDKVKSLFTEQKIVKKEIKQEAERKETPKEVEKEPRKETPRKPVGMPVNPFLAANKAPSKLVEKEEKKEVKETAPEKPEKREEVANPFSFELGEQPEVLIQRETSTPFFGQAAPAFEAKIDEPIFIDEPQELLPNSPSSFELQKPKKKPPVVFIGIIAAIVLGIAYYFFGGSASEQKPELPPLEQIAPEQYEVAWNSGVPSQMLPVALAALEPGSKVTSAEQIILKSALQEDKKLPGINNTLIKVAFDTRWEGELRRADRRATLALAMSGLLRDRMPQDLANLADLHPGVILAVTATANGPAGTAALGKIPAEILTQLTLPLGYTFKLLIDGRAEMTCADQGIQSLARLIAFGLDNKERIADFLSADGARRLSVFAFMYSQDNSRAESVLNILLNDPEVKIEDPNILWGKQWELNSWDELEASDKLFVLAGVAPSRELRPQNIGKLFSHPARGLRTYAIEKSLDRISFSHPGAKEVFAILKTNPELLNGDDTLRLALLLENPAKVTTQIVRGWLKSEPPLEIIAPLLLATAQEKTATKLDFEFARYLKEKKWNPDVPTLSRLYAHPDSFTRVMAYSKTFELEDKETAYMFLERAKESESEKEFKDQIDSMLKVLKKELTSGE